MIETIKRLKIAVIGDVMLDHYIFGNVDRISPEAPVPVLNVKDEKFYLGGAANVARNLKDLGVNVYLIGCIGKDESANIFKKLCENENINAKLIETNRITTKKTRIVAHSQQIVRVDREQKQPIDYKTKNEIVKAVTKENIDAIIISDYGKGVISSKLIEELRNIFDKFISVDPKVNHTKMYKDVDLITPNLKETQDMSKIEIQNDNDLKKAANIIIKNTKCKYLLVTQGENGMTLFSQNGFTYHEKALAKEVYDVTGAGDTVIAVSTMCFALGFDPIKAVKLSSIAASIVVGKRGTSSVKFEEIKDYL
ncbi:MAG: D-glycero-beta-D-manno-heptose-7-phosphate kinase [Desulfurella sp.]|uniref:RfaE bifunctional protein, domain I n=3 Tax=Desulfurella TaxID=33001 RepID=A0A1G6R349_9BACT|nr:MULTISPECIES: D-glycero-beta-D-manno-heptose-7-phosphate kinase [Desulfurella]PMP63086.1 MAG: D-glycero-beta-D-manno-heptose-7-phosphate kinase [Desulfurella multipotens]PMP89923.1 MAG: D-glycero-beta-D-manno-heptose-7-phosphate kinase [Desulfurella sp.]SDC98346.1 rfaE bifunctional protein, domain I [Desulfurella multipotens]HEX13207.1 D-glycero-beta-D-manno-heptose-7-phosphate kinase [Desulfurella acetivorans]